MDVGVELRNPVSRDQEGGQVEEVDKHFVAVTASERTGNMSINMNTLKYTVIHVNTVKYPLIHVNIVKYTLTDCQIHVNTHKHRPIHVNTLQYTLTRG